MAHLLILLDGIKLNINKNLSVIIMSLRKPYLDVRGLPEKEAYTLIHNCIRRNYLMLSIPKYRVKQIQNAILFANISQDKKDKLYQEVNDKLKNKRTGSIKRKKIKMKDITFFNQGRIRSILENPIPARIIYHGNGPKK